jgi:Flp pilus assembly protein TadD
MQQNDLRLTEAEGYFRVGEVLADMNQFEEAAAQYRASLALYAGDAIVHHQLGLALLHAGNPAEAAAPLQRAVELNPAEPRFWINRGYCAYQMRDEALAESCYARALAWTTHCPTPGSTARTCC